MSEQSAPLARGYWVGNVIGSPHPESRMVPLPDLWLPILLSAVAVFVLSFLVWTALPHHKSDFKKLPAEDATINALRERPPEPGAYMLPLAWTHADLKSPEIAQKLTEGPVGFINIVPSGMPTTGTMGKKFVQLLVFYLVLSVLVAYVTGTAFAADAAGMDVFRISATVAAMGHGTGVITAAVYFGTPWSNTWRHVIDAVIYGLATGAIFAWLWP